MARRTVRRLRAPYRERGRRRGGRLRLRTGQHRRLLHRRRRELQVIAIATLIGDVVWLVLAFGALQRHELAGLLRPMPGEGQRSRPSLAVPLPANWSLSLTDRQPLQYVQVEPTVIAEVEVDIATGPGGRPRHHARHIRTRAELLPEHLPLWTSGSRT